MKIIEPKAKECVMIKFKKIAGDKVEIDGV